MSKASDAYGACRGRSVEIATDLSPDELARSVPACPDWNVTELVAHLIGVAEDFATDNLGKAGSEQWTRDQIARRSGLAMPALIDEWESMSRELDPFLDEIAEGKAAMLIADAATHEHDFREAVGRPGARDSEAVWIALDRYVRRFGKRIKDAELPSVIVRCADRRWQAGVLEPSVELEGQPFDVLRALSGRRTIAEIASLDWTGDPTPYLELVSSYSIPRSSLSEG